MAQSPFSLTRFRAALRHFVAGRLAQAASTVALTLVTIRLLEQRDYGTYMVVWGLVELAVPLTSLGLLPAAQRFLPEVASQGTAPRLRRLVTVLATARFGVVLLACLMLGLFWTSLAQWLQLVDMTSTHAAIIAVLVGSNLMFRFAAEMLESLLEQRYAQTVRALLPLGRLLGLASLWALGRLDLQNLLLVEASCSVALWLLAEWWLRRRLRMLHPDGSYVLDRREFWTFVWHMSGVQVLNAAANVGLLRMVVSRALGVEVAGQFAFLQQLVMIAQRYLPSTLLANLIRPMLIARHVDGQQRDVALALGLLWKANLMLVWPLLPAALLTGSAVILLLSGGRVANAGVPLALLTLGLASVAQNQIVVMAMQVYRYSALARRISLLAVTAPVLVWFGAAAGLEGAAAGLAMALVLRGSVGLWALQRQPLRASLDWHGVGRFVTILLPSTLAAWVCQAYLGSVPASALLLVLLVAGTRLLPPIKGNEMALIGRALGGRARWMAGWARR